MDEFDSLFIFMVDLVAGFIKRLDWLPGMLILPYLLSLNLQKKLCAAD